MTGSCASCDRPAILCGLCAQHFMSSDVEPARADAKCGWCAEPAIVKTSCSAPACRQHVYHAMEQVGLVMRHVKESWDRAMPVRPDTADNAVHLALVRSPNRRIEDVPLP